MGRTRPPAAGQKMRGGQDCDAKLLLSECGLIVAQPLGGVKQ